MCGIVGKVALSKNNKSDLRVSQRFIRNRGPDGSGEFRNDRINISHTHLAVVDEDGPSGQPIKANDLVLACNGEVYNYRDIKKMGGYNYSGTSDCEAIMHAYALEGVEGIDRLDGTFSFVLYDMNSQKVILHRDNVGKKPLYVSVSDDFVVFSSSARAVADNMNQSPSVNQSQIGFYLENGFIHPTETIFESIVPVRPGEIYEIHLRNSKVESYIFNKGCNDIDVSEGPDEVEKNAKESLFSAVEKRIAGVDSPTLMFSGGVDSTLLACIISELGRKDDLRLVSLKQPVGVMHDEPYVKEASDKLGKEVFYVPFTQSGLLDWTKRQIQKVDQPLSLPSYFFLSRLVEKAKDFGKVLLTGDGGDETFLGYGSMEGWFKKEEESGGTYDFQVGPPPPDWFSNHALKTVNTDLAGHGFVKIDSAVSENQMEARNPFLDWHLMCMAWSIPKNYWAKYNTDKKPLKDMLSRYGFSDKFIHRKKIGFSYPLRYVMLPFYRSIKKFINQRKSIINTALDPDFSGCSYFDIFSDFDYCWKLFVLLQYIESNDIKIN